MGYVITCRARPARQRSAASLRQLLGLLWLADGLLLLQPLMLTRGASLLVPITAGQPQPLYDAFTSIARFTTENAGPVDVAVAVIQIEIGLLLVAGKYVNQMLTVSILWSVIVWYGGEGLGGLLTGRAGILTGAPGPVIFYLILAVVIYSTSTSAGRQVRPVPSGWSRLDRVRAFLCLLLAWLLITWCFGELVGFFFTHHAGGLPFLPGLITVEHHRGAIGVA